MEAAITAVVGLLSTVAGIVLLCMQQRAKATADRATERNAAKEELRKALAEGRITDAAAWSKRVQELGD